MTNPTTPQSDPALAQALTELVSLGLRMARAVTQVTEAEQATVAVAKSWLPALGAEGADMGHAHHLGLMVDNADELLGHAGPRITALAQSFERIARTVRRTVALARRLEQGWPPPRAGSDDRWAMLLRQAVRGVKSVIRARVGDGEAAERLFDDLAVRLEDPDYEPGLLERPVEEMVRILCRDLGLEPEAAATVSAPKAGVGQNASPGRRHDPG